MASRPDLSENGIRAFCRHYLKKTLKLDPDTIAGDAPFASIGLDSAESVFLVSALAGWSGLDLPAELAMDHPSLDELVRAVAAQVPPGAG